MMRWLYVNGADTRYDDVAVGFPMYVAACNYRLDICKWLFAHGAANDIKARTRISQKTARHKHQATSSRNRISP